MSLEGGTKRTKTVLSVDLVWGDVMVVVVVLLSLFNREKHAAVMMAPKIFESGGGAPKSMVLEARNLERQQGRKKSLPTYRLLLIRV